MIIPYTMLNGETLRGIVEEFVLREGTDYGYGQGAASDSASASTLEAKVLQVMKQLERGDAVVLYDQESETCDLVARGSKAFRVASEAPLNPQDSSENEE